MQWPLRPLPLGQPEPLHPEVAGRDKEMREAQKDLGVDVKVTFNVSHVETFAKHPRCSNP